MPVIHAEVTEEDLEYLEEWADAADAEVHEIAGDAIHNGIHGY